MSLSLPSDLLLQLGSVLVDVHIGDQLVVLRDLDLQQTRTAALALEVLQDFVIGRTLFLVLAQNTVDAVDGGVSDELFKVLIACEEKVPDVRVEDYVEG